MKNQQSHVRGRNTPQKKKYKVYSWGYTLAHALKWYRDASGGAEHRCIIAAAPELLAALQKSITPFNGIPDSELLLDWQREAREAIRKAKGSDATEHATVKEAVQVAGRRAEGTRLDSKLN